jgi:PAS domain S-box-containing protein
MSPETSNLLFQNIFAESSVGMAVVTLDGAFEMVNPSLCRLVGYDEPELLSKRLLELSYHEDVPEEERYMEGLRRRQMSRYRLEKRVVHKRGHLIWVNQHATLVERTDGDPVYFIAHLQDITEEKEVDRMKTEFVSLASHQLRTPLTAIKWYSDMLLKDMMGPLNDKQRSAIESIFKSNERMLMLIRGLLNISRMESGRLKIEPRPTDLRELVSTVVADLTPRMEEKHIQPDVTIDPGLSEISLDPKLMRHVCTNLITNAIRYSTEGSTITIRLQRTGDEIILQVSDTGIGIPQEAKDHLFEKFFRAPNATRMATDGNGLGLYLTKSIVEASQGRIWYESQENKGTTFWVSLPATGINPRKGAVSLDG